jgi:hypothetical protein
MPPHHQRPANEMKQGQRARGRKRAERGMSEQPRYVLPPSHHHHTDSLCTRMVPGEYHPSPPIRDESPPCCTSGSGSNSTATAPAAVPAALVAAVAAAAALATPSVVALAHTKHSTPCPPLPVNGCLAEL